LLFTKWNWKLLLGFVFNIDFILFRWIWLPLISLWSYRSGWSYLWLKRQ
jgi:hypothetical protein